MTICNKLISENGEGVMHVIFKVFLFKTYKTRVCRKYVERQTYGGSFVVTNRP